MDGSLNKELIQFRWTAFAEGLSYIVLLFIAMPLKYIWAAPTPVRVVGMIHGILFILYVIVGLRASRAESWTRRFEIMAFLASLIPFGTFYLDSHLRNRQD